MDTKLSAVIDESINLELNVAALYNVFCRSFPEDVDFWWNLVIEENNHAALLKSIRDIFIPGDVLPAELISSSLRDLQNTNADLMKRIGQYKETPPSREEAFRVAVQLEQSAGEIHYQRFMKKESDSGVDRVFQRLNRDDKDHAERILSYMKENNI